MLEGCARARVCVCGWAFFLRHLNWREGLVVVWQLMCLSDLEFDYINPFDSASRINKLVVPEIALHVGLSCLYLVFGYWLIFLINVPLIYYHGRL